MGNPVDRVRPPISAARVCKTLSPFLQAKDRRRVRPIAPIVFLHDEPIRLFRGVRGMLRSKTIDYQNGGYVP
jgi:hypothetical protein